MPFSLSALPAPKGTLSREEAVVPCILSLPPPSCLISWDKSHWGPVFLNSTMPKMEPPTQQQGLGEIRELSLLHFTHPECRSVAGGVDSVTAGGKMENVDVLPYPQADSSSCGSLGEKGLDFGLQQSGVKFLCCSFQSGEGGRRSWFICHRFLLFLIKF